MKKTLGLFMIFALILIGCSNNDKEKSSEDSKDKIEIKLVHEAPEDHPQGIGSDMFKDLVDERLGDKVEVTVYPNASLFDIDEGLEALQSGNIQMLSGPTAALVGMDPAYQLYNMPFLFNTTEQLRRFDESEAGLELRSKVEKNNLKILSMWFGNFKQITNSKTKIEKPEDLEKLKIRVMAGGLLEDQYTNLGASAVVLPYNELYMALQQGTVDGQENTFTEIAASNLFEVQDYLTVTNHAPGSYPFITNKEFWEELPEDIREELENIILEVTDEVEVVVSDIKEKDFNTIKETDIEITELNDKELEAFKEAFDPLYDKYRDIIGGELIDAAIDFE